MRFWNRDAGTSRGNTDWRLLLKQKRKGGLLAALQSEAARYTPDDLDILLQRYAVKIRTLPADYREDLKKYARIQIADGYTALATAELDAAKAREKLPAIWPQYVAFVMRETDGGNARLRSLKYLITAYTIFIEEKPPHPAGMPFPGGRTVERIDGVYCCPVRESWEGIDTAVCRFCPAVQTRGCNLVQSKELRDAAAKDEKIANYFYNFKG